ncbi:hypothetical protein AAZX31_14G127500 [Glycine max]
MEDMMLLMMMDTVWKVSLYQVQTQLRHPGKENLWSQMRRMGLGETEASHLVLGNVKQALELLVQQRYLQKDKVNGP